MNWTQTAIAMFGAVTLAGTICLACQVFALVKIDAKTRGLGRPRLWGFLSISGQGGGGLLVYLIHRKNYPVVHCTDPERQQMRKCKKAAALSLVCIVAGLTGFVLVAAPGIVS